MRLAPLVLVLAGCASVVGIEEVVIVDKSKAAQDPSSCSNDVEVSDECTEARGTGQLGDTCKDECSCDGKLLCIVQPKGGRICSPARKCGENCKVGSECGSGACFDGICS